MAGSPTSARAAGSSTIPLLYRLFFLYIEPVATAVGAYYAALDQQAYMHLTLPSVTTAISACESTVLYQLANLYFVFALNEALVLRATSDVRVWKVFLFGLLLADFGHLASVRGVMGWEVYYRFGSGTACIGAILGLCMLGLRCGRAFSWGLGLGVKVLLLGAK